jgi:hypothetical protein
MKRTVIREMINYPEHIKLLLRSRWKKKFSFPPHPVISGSLPL